ncbi:MAG: hypothetical protein Q8880_02490 [Bacteroidota bacterium]|nr:hypothetical protein [Bacteroidota bacterium]
MNKFTKKLSTFLFFTILSLFCFNAYSQEKGGTIGIDSINKKIDNLQSQFKVFKNLKISGYIQAQYQIADSTGAKTYEGGDFASGVDKRFMVKRGRLKVDYSTPLTQYFIQFDMSEKQFATKDAYIRFTEPWYKTVSLTTGIFYRPFGHELANFDSPERSRYTQTIFPGEEDCGAMLTFQLPNTSPLNFIKIQGGMFNGIGPTASDFDKYKDFIGQIILSKSFFNGKLKVGLGASYYNGGFANATKYVYSNIYTTSDGIKVFSFDSSATNKGSREKREYMGLDFQIYYDSPIGLTTIKGECVKGTQPGTISASTSATVLPTADTYVRNFNAYDVYFIQRIGKSKHQIIIKYDMYDPNKDVNGNEIGAITKEQSLNKVVKGITTTGTDLKYHTLGLGWMYNWDSNITITAYYDNVKNETTKNIDFLKDSKGKISGQTYINDFKDNVFTLRIQYKF